MAQVLIGNNVSFSNFLIKIKQDIFKDTVDTKKQYYQIFTDLDDKLMGMVTFLINE